MNTLVTTEVGAQQAATTDWDYVVIGSGIGGGTLAYALAKAGKQVLLCERGIASQQASTGAYAESLLQASPSQSREEIYRCGGRAADLIRLQTDHGRSHVFTPFIGAGVGGSSALYGMAMERFFPIDFQPAQCFAADGNTLPERWPFSYETLEQYYRQAEQLYRLRGSIDPLKRDCAQPLNPPLALTAANQRLFDHFRSLGMNPYQIPSAMEPQQSCDYCQGYLCARQCKLHAGNVCAEQGPKLLANCEVTRLHAGRHQVHSLEARHQGELINISGRCIVLAAGALFSPLLLLNSRNEYWPNGLANESDQVGRNLMRHYTDVWAVRLNGPSDNRAKQIASNDLYWRNGNKLGTIQSFGRLPPTDIVLDSLRLDVANSRASIMAPLVGLMSPLLRPTIDKLVQHDTLLASIIEDLPYRDNRIEPGNNGIPLLSYRISPQDRKRIALMRQQMRDILRPLPFQLLKQAENTERIAHVCGTCRAGDNPASSVVDANNRAHGLDNLYIVDSSFFPSSGGTNPSLTIAANALRVADILLGHRPQAEAPTTAITLSTSFNARIDAMKHYTPQAGDWALVTGANSGIGLEFCRQLAAQGMHLVLVGRRELELQRVADQFQNVRHLVIQADLSETASAATIKHTVAQHGIRIRLLVNNAASGHWGRFEQTPADVYEAELRTAGSWIRLCHEFLPELKAQAPAAIINVSSAAAYQPVPYMSVYAATKSLIQHFSLALYEELRGDGVHVQTLVPGPTATDFDRKAGAHATAINAKRDLASHVVQMSLQALGQDCPAVNVARNTFMQRFFAGLFPPRMVVRKVAEMFRPPNE